MQQNDGWDVKWASKDDLVIIGIKKRKQGFFATPNSNDCKETVSPKHDSFIMRSNDTAQQHKVPSASESVETLVVKPG